jgi:hypothetical protein
LPRLLESFFWMHSEAVVYFFICIVLLESALQKEISKCKWH